MEISVKLANSLPEKILTKLTLSSADYLDELYYQIESKIGLYRSDYVLISNHGVKLTQKSVLFDGDSIQLSPTVLGGKGGFGSLLRAFGKQITKSTNKEACRDLTGRRIRHVNNEKKLKDFLSKQNELAKKKEEDKKERMERRRRKRENLESSHHLFVDPKYDEQKQKIAEDLDEAINKGIKKKEVNKKTKTEAVSSTNLTNSDDESSNPKSSSSEKSSEENSNGEIKPANKLEKPISSNNTKDSVEKKQNTTDKLRDWLGVGDLEVSSSEEENEEPAKKMKKI